MKLLATLIITSKALYNGYKDKTLPDFIFIYHYKRLFITKDEDLQRFA